MSDSIGLYIHIPFCHSKCPYCDFFSVKGKAADFKEYTESLKKNLLYWSSKISKSTDTVYFGGGTPGEIGAELLSDILLFIKGHFNVTKDAEITLEVNPNSGKDFDFKTVKDAGFNRVSVGLQSADINELKLLGRTHSVRDAVNTIALARKAGINNISLDLMLGIPEQSKESLKRSIDFCAERDVNHISSYILKLEENTVFYKRKDKLNLPDEDESAALYLFALEYLDKKGFKQYEISNFSKTGFESRHNLKYWNLDEYLGVGPTAHSLINNKRFYYNNSFKEFKQNKVIFDCEGNTEEEYIMLQLRLSSGLNLADCKKIFGHKLSEDFLAKAEKYQRLGLLNIDGDSIRLTQKGFLVSNTIISDFI